MDEACTTETMTEVEIAEAIGSATIEVFSTMLGMEPVAGKMETGDTSGQRTGIVALLGFAGDWIGSGALCCEGRFGCRMAGQLLMAEYDSVNEDVLDAIAEVANMIIGNVKTALELRLGIMGLSTPTVIYGRNFETRNVGSREWVSVPFTFGEDVMAVQVSIAPNTKKDRVPPPKTTFTGNACPYCGTYQN
jgi:chemotaxis protein CheX